jgi:hypothetical protein
LRFTDTRWYPSGVSRRDVDAGVDVRIAGKAAGDTAEPGLAVARVLADPPAGTAAQAGIGGPDLLYPAGRLVLGAPDQQAPGLGQDRPVQARLRVGTVAQVRAGTPGVRLRRGPADHGLYPQVLETDHVEPLRQTGGDLLAPVLTPVSPMGPEPGDAGTLRLLLRRSPQRPGLTSLGLAQFGPFPARHARAMELLARRQRRGDHHAPVDTHHLPGTRRRDRVRDDRERDVPPPGPVQGHPVGPALRHRPRPPEPHPADLRDPDLAPAPVQPPHMQAEREVGDAESLVHVPLAATGAAVGAGVEVPHRLAEVPQRLLLHILRSGRQPRVLRPRLGEHPRLFDVTGQRPHRPPLLVDVLVPVPVDPPRCRPVGLQGAELVQIPGQVPHIPGVRAVPEQDSFLLKRGVQPVPGHATTVPGTTDILERRQRGLTRRPKAAVPPRDSDGYRTGCGSRRRLSAWRGLPVAF